MNIEWHKVTWYSKSIALVLFVTLPFIGFWFGAQYGEDVAPVSSITTTTGAGTTVVSGTTSASNYYSNVAEWQTDANNTAGGFSLAYPIDFSTQDNYPASQTTDWRVNANNISGVKYFTLTIPKAFESQTNFDDATLAVGASGATDAVAQCLVADQSGGAATTATSATINGIKFSVFKSSGAGAGNIYETTSYRTVHTGKCYAVEYTIHSSQIANYPSSYDLKPFNENKLADLLGRIVSTFKFQ